MLVADRALTTCHYINDHFLLAIGAHEPFTTHSRYYRYTTYVWVHAHHCAKMTPDANGRGNCQVGQRRLLGFDTGI